MRSVQLEKIGNWIAVVLILLVGAGMVFIAAPGSSPTVRSPVSVELQNAKGLYYAIRLYANDHNGVYPVKLADISSTEISEEARHFRDPKTREELDWIYYGGRDDDAGARIVLASPREVSGHRRLVVHSDGAVFLMDESDFEKKMAAEQASMNRE